MDVTAGVRLADGTGRRSSPASTTIPASASAPAWSPGPPPSRCATHSRRHDGPWVPEAILTDNGKVFTGRFGPARPRPLRPHLPGERHPPPASPPRAHRRRPARWSASTRPSNASSSTARSSRRIDEAQADSTPGLGTTTHEREHQSLGNRPPATRFALARPRAPSRRPGAGATAKATQAPAAAAGSAPTARSACSSSSTTWVAIWPARTSTCPQRRPLRGLPRRRAGGHARQATPSRAR